MFPVKESVLCAAGQAEYGYLYISIAKALARYGLWEQITETAGSGLNCYVMFLLALLPEKTHHKICEDMNTHLLIAPADELGLWHHLPGHPTVFKKIDQSIKQYISERLGEEHINITFHQWHEMKECHPELELKDFSCIAENAMLNPSVPEEFSYRSIHADVPIRRAIQASMFKKTIGNSRYIKVSDEHSDKGSWGFHNVRKEMLRVYVGTEPEIIKMQQQTGPDDPTTVYINISDVRPGIESKSCFTQAQLKSLDVKVSEAIESFVSDSLLQQVTFLPAHTSLKGEASAVNQVLNLDPKFTEEENISCHF